MAKRNPRIGEEATADHKRIWPQETITGGRCDPRRSPIRRSIGNGQFVVLDNQLPPDFDLDAAIAELTGAKASKATK